MRLRHLLVPLVVLVASVEADACSIALPPPEETAKQIAAEGVLIRGVVIQGFDAAKQQPEIIRAETVYVGGTVPRDFVIYRHPMLFEEVLHPPKFPSPCAGLQERPHKVGEVLDRLVLRPAKSIEDPGAVNGRWMFTLEGRNVMHGKGLRVLIEEATLVGRFQSRPPNDATYDD
jgi:hypothetical protein